MSDIQAIRERIEETGALLAAGASLRAVHAEALYKACRTLLSALPRRETVPTLTEEEWTNEHQTSLVAAVYDAMWHWGDTPMDTDDSISLAEMLRDKLRENGLALSLISKLTEPR